jgi:hypothetical protein
MKTYQLNKQANQMELIRKALAMLGILTVLAIAIGLVITLWVVTGLGIWQSYGYNAFLYYLIATATCMAIGLVVVW